MLYGVCVFFWWFCAIAHAECDVQPRKMKGAAWRSAVVTRVLDGDTLELENGDRVRFASINAPETAKFNKAGDPLGNEAWHRLEALAGAGSTVFLRRDRIAQDHYGRFLLHPFDADGHNLSALLLGEGLGFHVAIPPNLWSVDCYHEVEARAINAGAGVWKLAAYTAVDAEALPQLHGGYSHVKGRVEKISLMGRVAWVDMVGNVAIKVAKNDLATVNGRVWQRLVQAAQQGKLADLPMLEVHGWMSDRREWEAPIRKQIENGERKVFQFKVRHRYDWRLLDATPSV